MRRTKPAVHKAASQDDKKLQTTLKRLNVNNIPGIEEVRLRVLRGRLLGLSFIVLPCHYLCLQY